MPRFVWPVRGRISSPYGWRVHPVYKNRQFHGGIDIVAPVGTSVRAAAAGKVIRSGYMGAFGYGVVIDHGRGVTTWYGHNSRLSVKVGEKVKQGQVIARSGNSGITTGPHVDFRIKVDGDTVNPIKWLP
jgi:murein DD-endopeptidase MepM/ murein hydrolase activator NlpD